MTSNSCCCETVLFDGSCFDSKDNLIAFCVQSISRTAANCFESVDNQDGDGFTCQIGGTCPTTPLVSSNRMFISVGIFYVGLGTVVSCAIACVLSCRAFKEDDEEDAQEKVATETKVPEIEDGNPKGGDERPENMETPCVMNKSTDDSAKSKDETSERKNEIPEIEDEITDSEDKRPESVIDPSFSVQVFVAMLYQFLILGGLIRDYETTLIVLGSLGLLFSATFLITQYGLIISSPREKWIREDCNNDPIILVTDPCDIYDDFAAPLDLVVVVFICQITLLGLYINAIFMSGTPDFSSPETYVFYIMGALIQMAYQKVTSKSQFLKLIKDEQTHIGTVEHWEKIFSARRKDGGVIFNNSHSEQIRHQMEWSLTARYIMSALVNSTGTILLFILLPMHLSHSGDAIDFVLNATAAYFIIELDNQYETEQMKLHIDQGEYTEYIAEEQRKKKDSKENEDNGVEDDFRTSPPINLQMIPDEMEDRYHENPNKDEHENEHQETETKDENEDEGKEKNIGEEVFNTDVAFSDSKNNHAENPDSKRHSKSGAQISGDGANNTSTSKLEIKSGDIDHKKSKAHLLSSNKKETQDPEV